MTYNKPILPPQNIEVLLFQVGQVILEVLVIAIDRPLRCPDQVVKSCCLALARKFTNTLIEELGYPVKIQLSDFFEIFFSYLCQNEELWQMLAAIYHDYTAYAISFLVIGFFWLGHHTKFRSITRYDGVIIWLNFFLLMTVAFIPFPTRVMSDYINSTSTIFYAATIVVAGMLTAAISFYAVHNDRLVDPNTPLHRHMKQPWLLIGMPLIFLLSIPIAVYEPLAARAFWLLLIPLQVLKASRG